MHISLNKGVCGKIAFMKKTEIVADVHQFPRHIACDPRSNSEIVVPVFWPDSDKFFGVLDSPLLTILMRLMQCTLNNLCRWFLDISIRLSCVEVK